MVKLRTHKKKIFGAVKGIKCWSLISIPKLDITCQHSASLRVITCCKGKKEIISEILICLYGTKHQLFHKWNMICVWNIPLQLESLNGAYSCSQSSKTREPHLLQSLQSGSYKYSSSVLMRFWMLCLLPKWLLEYFVGFALLGQKLTSRAVHMENIFRNVGKGKSWWGHQNNSASHYCWSHHSQNVHVSQANSPTSHSTVLSFELLVPCSMKLYFIPIRFHPLCSTSPF